MTQTGNYRTSARQKNTWTHVGKRRVRPQHGARVIWLEDQDRPPRRAARGSGFEKMDKEERMKPKVATAVPIVVKTEQVAVLPPSDEDIARMLFAEINGMRRRR